MKYCKEDKAKRTSTQLKNIIIIERHVFVSVIYIFFLECLSGGFLNVSGLRGEVAWWGRRRGDPGLQMNQVDRTNDLNQSR